jgi:hypothetical protein
MISKKILNLLGLIILITSCAPAPVNILITNNTDLLRENEVVEIAVNSLPEQTRAIIDDIGVFDPSQNKFLTTQLIDKDQDGIVDELIFQPQLNPMETKSFQLKVRELDEEAIEYCYSRIVPTRIDDYTWENDKVAFRTYGPAAQLLVEEGKKGGIISSGFDCWLKKVDYPIINKWYKNSEEKGISYHEDHGEGLDNYHVGISRGAGGLAIKGEDDQYFVSKNFTSHKTIATGPLRTLFELDYENWQGPNGAVSEKKTISLDYGNNLMKIEVDIAGTENVAAGISLQENNGTVLDRNNIVIYKQNHFETILSNAILTPQKHHEGYHVHNPKIQDQNHVFLDLKVLNQSLVYYVGFYWSESNQFSDHDAWEQYLNEMAIKIENPLQIDIN